ncbi:MAG TPA: cation:proton antiporter [Mycobacteriales bacterium]|nr:cation:proton antiporter [Mycobacteriales bacterium]
MSFATLALIGAVALAGPLLALIRRFSLPMLLGELMAGIALGATGAGVLHADNKTFVFLANVGFALVMFVAGSHVPVRDARVRAALRVGGLRAVGVGVVSAGLGLLLAHLFSTGHAPLYAVLLASSSAALILPLLEQVGVSGGDALTTIAQVAVADTACIVALPLVIEPSKAGRAALGALAVAAATLVVWAAFAWAQRSGYRRRMHKLSEQRHFALELRISLTLLFALAALATATHVSVMLAGFGIGLAVAAIGEPRRLAHQLFALTEGFFGPLFFVWIGAALDLRALSGHPKYIPVGIALGAAAVLAHGSMRLAGQPGSAAVVTSAQLGVPIAAVTLGTQQHLLHTGEPAAILLGALVTIAAATVAARRQPTVTADGPESSYL